MGLLVIGGTVCSTLAAYLMGYSRADIRDGLYGFNGALAAVPLSVAGHWLGMDGMGDYDLDSSICRFRLVRLDCTENREQERCFVFTIILSCSADIILPPLFSFTRLHCIRVSLLP